MSESYAYRILDQGRVMQALQQSSGVSPVGEITEREARRIKPHLEEAATEVHKAIEQGVEPKQAVEEVIEKYGKVAEERGVLVSGDTIARAVKQARDESVALPIGHSSGLVTSYAGIDRKYSLTSNSLSPDRNMELNGLGMYGLASPLAIWQIAINPNAKKSITRTSSTLPVPRSLSPPNRFKPSGVTSTTLIQKSNHTPLTASTNP